MAASVPTGERSLHFSLLACSVCLLVAISCGANGPPKSAEPSASLDGIVLEHPGSVAFVALDHGVAVVDGARDGALAIATPDEEGGYRWFVDQDAGRLDGVVAWHDDEVIRVAGHRCPTGTKPGTNGDDGDRCPSAPLVTVTFTTDSQQWGPPSPEIETGGIVTDLVAGEGDRILAASSDGRPSTGLALVDVSTHSITNLADDPGPAGAMACPSGSRFVRVTSPSDGSVEGAKTSISGPSVSEGALTVELIGAGSARTVPLRGAEALNDMTTGRVSVVGCADDGAVLQVDENTDDDAAPFVVRAGHDGSSAEVSMLPAGPYGGPPHAAYFTDLTSRRVLSRQIRIAEDQEHRAAPFSILGPDGEWRPASSTLAEGETVVMSSDRDGYLVSITDRGMRLRAFTT